MVMRLDGNVPAAVAAAACESIGPSSYSFDVTPVMDPPPKLARLVASLASLWLWPHLGVATMPDETEEVVITSGHLMFRLSELQAAMLPGDVTVTIPDRKEYDLARRGYTPSPKSWRGLQANASPLEEPALPDTATRKIDVIQQEQPSPLGAVGPARNQRKVDRVRTGSLAVPQRLIEKPKLLNSKSMRFLREGKQDNKESETESLPPQTPWWISLGLTPINASVLASLVRSPSLLSLGSPCGLRVPPGHPRSHPAMAVDMLSSFANALPKEAFGGGASTVPWTLDELRPEHIRTKRPFPAHVWYEPGAVRYYAPASEYAALLHRARRETGIWGSRQTSAPAEGHGGFGGFSDSYSPRHNVSRDRSGEWVGQAVEYGYVLSRRPIFRICISASTSAVHRVVAALVSVQARHPEVFEGKECAVLFYTTVSAASMVLLRVFAASSYRA